MNNLYETQVYKLLDRRKSPFLSMIKSCYEYAFKFLPQINRIFFNYTGHGITHSINVVEYMFQLCDDPEQLSDLELTVLIYVALLHDIGMAVSENEIEAIKKDDLGLVDRKYSLVLEKYGDENVALQECIRPIHARRSLNHINTIIDSCYFIIPGFVNISFKNEVALICNAHNENFEWITNNLSTDAIKGNYVLNSQYLAMLLRIADYLDIDEERAPLYLYKFLKPKEFGDLEWRQHFVIENKDKIVLNQKTGYKNIEFYGESSTPSVHRKLLKYFDLINDELKKSIELSETFFDNKYLLHLKPTVINKIRTKGFSFSDFKLSLDYKAVTSLLMGENIYGNKKYGLRELIQNSIDACKIMEEISKTKSEFIYNVYQPFISIVLDKDRKQVSILDNGQGMSLDILKKYFLNVGVSYYISDDYLFKGNKYIPIGNYGIGFLACFMLSDKVTVITKYYEDNQINKIEFERNSEYICLTYQNTPRTHGTEIILDYDQFLEVFNNNQTNIENFIKDNFIDCNIPIRIIFAEDGHNQTKRIELDKPESICKNGIVLDPYLENIQATVEFSYRGINFVKYLSDIDGNESYVFNEEENNMLNEYNVDLNLGDFIKNGVITYLNVPIIDSSIEEKFEKAYEVLEDFEEALEKVDYETVNLIAKNQEFYSTSSIISDGNESMIGTFTLNKFCQLVGHTRYTPTSIDLIEQRIIQGVGDKFLPYNIDMHFGGVYSFNHTDRIYIKFVLVSEAKLTIPYLLDGIQLKSVVINIFNKNIIPNVSRNNIMTQQNVDLAYAIGKALHLWILEHGGFAEEERTLISNFIHECYQDQNYCLKER